MLALDQATKVMRQLFQYFPLFPEIIAGSYCFVSQIPSTQYQEKFSGAVV